MSAINKPYHRHEMGPGAASEGTSLHGAAASARSHHDPHPDAGAPNVAVVVVHGVGPQEAGASAHKIADLLLNVDESPETAAYTPFVERRLRIRTQPMDPGKQPPAAPRTRREKLRASLRDHSPLLDRETAVDHPGILFMQGQLLEYKGDGPEDQYATIRLEGQRLRAGTPERAVHVYEMYWSDLVRVGSGFLQVFAELYQILFHLPSLGRHAVDYGRVHRQERLDATTWRLYSWLQAWATRLLTIGVPVLNLALLVVVASCFIAPLTLAENAHQWGIAAGGLGAVIAITGGLLAFYRLVPLPALGTTVGALEAGLGAGVVFAIVWHRAHPQSDVPGLGLVHTTLLFELLIGGLAAAAFVLRGYDRVRPGALVSGLVAGVAVLGLFLEEVVRRPEIHPWEHSLHAIEVVNDVLVVVWMVYLAFQLAAAGAGLVAARAPEERERDLVAKLAATARLSLALPTIAFLVFTIPLLTVVYDWIVSHAFEAMPGADKHAGRIFTTPGIEGFTLTFGLASVALGVAVVALLPSVLAEVIPPRLIDAANARRYGRWLTWGLRALTVPAEILVLAVATVLAVVIGARLLHFQNDPSLVNALAAFVGGSALTLTVLRGQLDQIALGMRSPLEAVLDVDTYLREYPRDAAPRAKICARYISLLRYLQAWRDPETGRGYDAIVIVAHSQGTVISADLLRFLTKVPDSSFDPKRLPISLFTMGSPLRQLYAERLPNLYAWCDASPDAQPQPWDHLVLPPDGQPSLAALGVTRWVNAYRSGDYVGRALWTPVDDATWDCVSPASDGEWLARPEIGAFVAWGTDGRSEFCVGPGAHTHYWDACGSRIALEIDRLVAMVRARV